MLYLLLLKFNTFVKLSICFHEEENVCSREFEICKVVVLQMDVLGMWQLPKNFVRLVGCVLIHYKQKRQEQKRVRVDNKRLFCLFLSLSHPRSLDL